MKNWKEELGKFKEKSNKREKDEKSAEELVKAMMGEDAFKRDEKSEVKLSMTPEERFVNNSADNKINKNNMSKENPTKNAAEEVKPPTPETVEGKTPTPETTPETATVETPKAQSRQTEEIFDVYLPNKTRFERLSDWAKEKVVSLYEKTGTHYLAESSVVGLAIEGGEGIFNRLEAAFNDKLMKWHEGKAINITQKLDNAKNQMRGFEMGKKGLESALAGLEKHKAQGISTAAAEANIRREMRDLDERMAKSQSEINKHQSRLESRNNKTAGYANARDRACENLKNRYDERLKPREKEIDNLKTYNESLENSIKRAEFQRDRIAKQIDDFQLKYSQFMTGGSLFDRLRGRDPLTMATAGLKTQLEEWNKRIDNISKEKSVIDGRLARAEDRANVYRDKKDAISNKTKGRPIIPEAGERMRSETHGEREEVRTEREYERHEEAERFALEEGINKWNKYLKEKIPNMLNRDLIDIRQFGSVTGIDISSMESFESFKDALDMYYKDKAVKMPREHFKKYIDSFEKDFEGIK